MEVSAEHRSVPLIYRIKCDIKLVFSPKLNNSLMFV